MSPDAISVAPDLTKPICSRPPDRTSIVAYSSATRTGSGRTVTRVPSERIFAFVVVRATAPVMTGLAAGQIVDPGMMLVGADIQAELVAKPVLVEHLVVELPDDSSDRNTGSAGSPAPKGRDRSPPAGRTDRRTRYGSRFPWPGLRDRKTGLSNGRAAGPICNCRCATRPRSSPASASEPSDFSPATAFAEPCRRPARRASSRAVPRPRRRNRSRAPNRRGSSPA